MTPDPGPSGAGDLWHVYTDGSTRHERRQTFSGWAARAVQPQAREVRQVSGARPGGTSLEAETEAILAGLRLVPGGAPARLHSDLDLGTLLEVLHSPAGEAARAHLADVWVLPVARNRGRHPADMHRVARAEEADARSGEPVGSTGLSNATQEALGLARTGPADPPLSLGEARRLPGQAGPLQLRVAGLPPALDGGPTALSLTLDLGSLTGRGRTPEEVIQTALHPLLTLLTHGALVEVRVPPIWAVPTQAAASGLAGVRVLAHPDPAQQHEEGRA
ncbi:hypothetical protein F8S09_07770 [Deinococcus sp. SDU3-2]|uniref:Uncharacterized protein n=1 Tax=Deinococcus terrestris TaxID=2651870 RepID=A0A7X1NVJ1_9DEIO|nr:hypothetical protein [Deinococcus terrestris]MPY66593.1 hypothetical protein [Deinococcus terrestris]